MSNRGKIYWCASPGQAASTAFWNLLVDIHERKNIKYKKYLLSDVEDTPIQISYENLCNQVEDDKDITYIIKCHSKPINFKLQKNDKIFLSVRDLYQASMSGRIRKNAFDALKLIDVIRNYLTIYDEWRVYEHFLIPFKSFVFEKKDFIKELLPIINLEFEEEEIEELIDANDNIELNYQQTLLSERHITSNKKYLHDEKYLPELVQMYLEKVQTVKKYQNLFGI